MIPKQDRQSVRRAVDLEQKYDFDKTETAVRAAADAKQAAEQASNAASEAKKTVEELNKDELIKRLTDDTGVISSADGTLRIDLNNNTMYIDTLVISNKVVSWLDNGDGTFTLIGTERAEGR